MKETYYTVMLIITYGTLERSGNEINWYVNKYLMQFKYTEIVCNQYTYQNYV